MAKLTYWYAERLTDADAYSVITKTKKEATALVAKERPGTYGPVEKRVIQYRDAFDLFDWVTSEHGGRGCGSIL